MKVREALPYEIFGIEKPIKQPTKFSCVGTCIAMILGMPEDEIFTTGFRIKWIFNNRKQPINLFIDLSVEEGQEWNAWLNGNGITMTVHRTKPKHRPSISVNTHWSGSGHAILALGDMGYIDPAPIGDTYTRTYPLSNGWRERLFLTFDFAKTY